MPCACRWGASLPAYLRSGPGPSAEPEHAFPPCVLPTAKRRPLSEAPPAFFTGRGRKSDQPLADDFFGLEEERDLGRGVLVRIRAVHRIRLDRLSQLLADRAGIGIGGVGRAHD